MNPLIVVGLATTLNAGVFGGGIYWLQRQRKRLRSERAREGIIAFPARPPDGETVQILVDDGSGMLAEYDAVCSPRGQWTDARTLLPIEDDVVGWRPLRAGRGPTATPVGSR